VCGGVVATGQLVGSALPLLFLAGAVAVGTLVGRRPRLVAMVVITTCADSVPATRVAPIRRSCWATSVSAAARAPP
jgi:hypothetical protein